MLKCSLILFLVIAGLPLTACEAQDVQKSRADRAALEKSALEAFNTYAGLIKESKFTEAVQFYANDPRFVWVEDGAIKYDSQAQIQRAFEGISSMGKVQNSFGRPTIWSLNDFQVMAFVKFRTTVARGTEKEFTYTGAITVVMEQSEAGWRFISGHSSSTPNSKGF